ncbi:hypothetical protein CVT25_011674 [Psilocybe cyanescens]|uniref:Uncharacterized protein n=1 Tax=Psilocybe cyanescens TaxID=93625 RepID=A0A409XWM1_PSICY|nr:hypothetical protein CVT25_011674 [Psilocybe cyanescens]
MVTLMDVVSWTPAATVTLTDAANSMLAATVTREDALKTGAIWRLAAMVTLMDVANSMLAATVTLMGAATSMLAATVTREDALKTGAISMLAATETLTAVVNSRPAATVTLGGALKTAANSRLADTVLARATGDPSKSSFKHQNRLLSSLQIITSRLPSLCINRMLTVVMNSQISKCLTTS